MNHKLSADDLQLFRDSMIDAIPLRQDHVELFQRHPPPRPVSQPNYLEESKTASHLTESEVVTDEFINFARAGVQQRLLHKLRQGHIAPQLELDLHGLTVVYAQENLELFLQECKRRALRCVRIIHGKGSRSAGGQPVLKCKVNYWLRCYDDVLAFTSTPRWDGGNGALYVLLRNPEKTKK